MTRRLTITNRRLAQWWVKWLIEHSTSHQLLWCIASFVLRNRQYAKSQTVGHHTKSPPHKLVYLVFADTQSQR